MEDNRTLLRDITVSFGRALHATICAADDPVGTNLREMDEKWSDLADLIYDYAEEPS